METTCTTQERHCTNCGSTDPSDLVGPDSYSDCCNEPIAIGPCHSDHN